MQKAYCCRCYCCCGVCYYIIVDAATAVCCCCSLWCAGWPNLFVWFIESDSSVLVLVTQTQLIFGSSVGGTVAFMASICHIYTNGNYGHTRIPGGRQCLELHSIICPAHCHTFIAIHRVRMSFGNVRCSCDLFFTLYANLLVFSVWLHDIFTATEYYDRGRPRVQYASG